MRNEVVLITGGSSGIGLAAAGAFVRRGARMILVARDAERLAAAARQVGGGARTIAADLTDPAQVAAMAESVMETEGRLDVLVNSAGQFEVGPAERDGVELAERLIRINYLGAVAATHACLPLLRRGSRRSIVNVSSLAGKSAPPFMAAYAASKWALAAYTYALRQELHAEGFHVGLVSPAPVRTPMIVGRIHTAHYRLPRGVPILTPETVAEAILRVVTRRSAEAVLPRHFSPLMRLGLAFPGLVDGVYRLVRRRETTEAPSPLPDTGTG